MSSDVPVLQENDSARTLKPFFNAKKKNKWDESSFSDKFTVFPVLGCFIRTQYTGDLDLKSGDFSYIPL